VVVKEESPVALAAQVALAAGGLNLELEAQEILHLFPHLREIREVQEMATAVAAAAEPVKPDKVMQVETVLRRHCRVHLLHTQVVGVVQQGILSLQVVPAVAVQEQDCHLVQQAWQEQLTLEVEEEVPSLQMQQEQVVQA